MLADEPLSYVHLNFLHKATKTRGMLQLRLKKMDDDSWGMSRSDDEGETDSLRKGNKEKHEDTGDAFDGGGLTFT